MTTLTTPLTEGAIRNACDGDNMLREYATVGQSRSRAWTMLTRLDTRVALDKPVTLDPIPAEKFDLWEAVGRR